MTTEKIVLNYTAEQTNQAVEMYASGKGASVEGIAELLGKSVRSVIAKLSKEGVYVPKATTKVPTLTKAMLIAKMEAKKELTPGTLKSLEKADKPALEALLQTM